VRRSSVFTRLLCTACGLVGWLVDPGRRGSRYARAIPRPASAYCGLRSHLTSLMSMNLITERADMPCIVVSICQCDRRQFWFQCRKKETD
jgi:hypothetical protein